MKRITSQVICHPLLVPSTLYLIDLLCRSDFGISGALFVLASRLISRLMIAMRT
ncbi:hypothetical protein AWB79_04529 [Caballeronia hypogeia]|uniref:Uncharacterized protein n=1 Tax=Caballeronia hypogeia TaxID=1777140 RepID=A0A158C0L5_9BURK|nr:hypothetical protein AWB79_04529 [Caballeronia hypogeia]